MGESGSLKTDVSQNRFARESYDAIVVGAGPNGLAAAIKLSQRGLKTVLMEKSSRTGGGLKCEELTLPGFRHDVGSAVHPLGIASPFFKQLPLEKLGLKWIFSKAEVAHPLDDGSAALLFRSVEKTAAQFEGTDVKNYRRFFSSLAKRQTELFDEVLSPPLHLPKHFGLFTQFGLKAAQSAELISSERFQSEKSRALYMGIAAHAASSLKGFASSAAGLVLQIAGHGEGWPMPEGGSENLARALTDYFISLGGEVITDFEVSNVNELPSADHVFFDLTPRQILKIAGEILPGSVRKSFERYRPGLGIFKVDWALSGPIPWKNFECKKACTVHLGGNASEIIAALEAVTKGETLHKPYVLLTQPTLFDRNRLPADSTAEIAWAYCHIPFGSEVDYTDAIENQVERFAPGFRKLILKRSTLGPKELEQINPNLHGGDISGGLVDAEQLFFRPRFALNPYALDGKKYWICSSSTPPGPGVHGMSGYHAALRAISR